jgi:uncharacterized protein YciW
MGRPRNSPAVEVKEKLQPVVASIVQTALEAEDETPQTIGAVEQLTLASQVAVRAGDQVLHAHYEMALFALYNLKTKLTNVDLGDAVGAIKTLL